MKQNVSDYRDALTLDLIRAERLRGRFYTMAQFSKKLECFRAEDYDWPDGEKWKHKEIIRKNSPTVLALDLGISTGWAIRSSGGSIESGTISFKTTGFYGGCIQFLKLERFLNEIDGMNDFNEVYFDEGRQEAQGAAVEQVNGALLSTLRVWCERCEIPYEGVPMRTIKVHATGKGSASKEEMIQSAQRRGHSPENDDEADALAILYWATGSRLRELCKNNIARELMAR